MINFVVCDDNKYVREFNENIISKVVMPYDFDYKINLFERFDKKLKNLINTPADMKIYILDLELPNKSGIDIAREIRKTDWNSIIIILTSHDELEFKLLKEKLLIFDFISKFDNYQKRLMETLNIIINKISNKKIIVFKTFKGIHHINYENILYIVKDNNSRKTKIVTSESEYIVSPSLTTIIKKLDSRFYQTHRACFVNLKKIKSVDFKNNIIYFKHNKKIDYLSRNYKKELRELL